MRARPRRWWTGLVSVLAGGLILMAVTSGVFQFAMLLVPAYREQVQTWVGEGLGRPLEIGGVSLVWRGFAPQVELSGVELLDEAETPLAAERLLLGFRLWDLLRGDWVPRRVTVSGLRLGITLQADGTWVLAGWPLPEPGAGGTWRAHRLPELRIEDADLRLLVPRWSPRVHRVAVSELRLRESATDTRLDVEGQLPRRLGGAFRLAATLDAPFEGRAEAPLRWRLSVEDLSPLGWWPDAKRPAARIRGAALRARLEGAQRAGRLEQLTLALDGRALEATRGSERWLLAEQLRLRLDARRKADDRLSLALTEALIDGQAAAADLRLTQEAGAWSLTASRLALDPLGPWLPVLWAGLEAPGPRLAGALTDLALHHDRDVPKGAVTLVNGGWAHPGLSLSGLEGSLRLTPEGLFWEAGPQPVVVEAPGLFSAPVPLRLAGEPLQWRRTAEGWTLGAEGLALEAPGGTASGRFWLRGGAGYPLALTLEQRLEAPEVAALKAYLPVFWPEPLRRWLDRAISGGAVEAGRLRIEGPLADFPFVERPSGVWSLALPLRNARLAFAPDWPALEGLDGELGITGRRLTIEARRARSGPLRGRAIRAEIPELLDARLRVQAEVQGPLSGYYDFLARSPLKGRLAALLEQTRGEGEAELSLGLDLPLKDLARAGVTGEVRLEAAALAVEGLSTRFEGLSGSIRFDERQLSSPGLSAFWGGVPVQARIEPEGGGVLHARARLPAEAPMLAEWLPDPLRRALEGAADWHAELPLTQAGAPLLLDSTLIGLGIGLPAPLDKPPAAAWPVSLRLTRGTGDERRLRLAFADQRLALELGWQPGKAPEHRNLHVSLGEALPDAPPERPGLSLTGRTPELDLLAWASVLDGAGGGLPLARVDLTAGRLPFGAFTLSDQRLTLSPLADGWWVELEGAARGRLRWQPQTALLSGELSRLALGFQPSSGAGRPGRDAPPDFAHWPLLRLDVGAISVNGHPLGKARVLATPAEGGYRLDELSLTGPDLEARLQGHWQGPPELAQLDLGFAIASREPERLLGAFGYAPNLDAALAELRGELHWAGNGAFGEWRAASGRLDLLAEQGVLRAVEPGAGRVLGLLNFYTLPRRLTLDFRDLTETGLHFDRISGGFDVQAGRAVTQKLRLAGPSVRLEVSGALDLAERTVDHTVRVLPGLSGGFTLGATLLGGPAAGVIMLLAQELLEKPLDQITQFGYRLRGPWDNPQITRLEAADVLGAKAAP